MLLLNSAGDMSEVVLFVAKDIWSKNARTTFILVAFWGIGRQQGVQ